MWCDTWIVFNSYVVLEQREINALDAYSEARYNNPSGQIPLEDPCLFDHVSVLHRAYPSPLTQRPAGQGSQINHVCCRGHVAIALIQLHSRQALFVVL